MKARLRELSKLAYPLPQQHVSSRTPRRPAVQYQRSVYVAWHAARSALGTDPDV